MSLPAVAEEVWLARVGCVLVIGSAYEKVEIVKAELNHDWRRYKRRLCLLKDQWLVTWLEESVDDGVAADWEAGGVLTHNVALVHVHVLVAALALAAALALGVPVLAAAAVAGGAAVFVGDAEDAGVGSWGMR